MSEYVAHTETRNGCKIEIIGDPDPQNPREEFEQITKMICFHSRYNLGDKHDFSEPQNFVDWLNEHESEVALVKPLYLYDHSGITISTTPFNDRFDSMRLGYVYITKEAFDTAIGNGWKRNDGTEVTPESLIDGEVETYDQYLRGDVYGFRVTEVTEDEDGEEIEGEEVHSCWGFYGEEYCLQEAQAVADGHEKPVQELTYEI